MNGTLQQVNKLTTEIKTHCDELSHDMDIVLCPSHVFIPQVAKNIAGTKILLGAQNCFAAKEGAYTGEISPYMLKEFACKYVIIGHSERRQLFKEDNELVARKFSVVYDAGLLPILCIGETKEQRERGETLEVVRQQLYAVLDKIDTSVFNTAIIAYEPVWAIGTGLSATPKQAQEVHGYIRALVAADVRILYGGSVKAENASEIFKQPDIDGGLIGGASLNADEFVKICRHAATKVMV